VRAELNGFAACSFGLSATSQQYFSLRKTSHQQSVNSTFLSEKPATSNQSTVLFS
jgi:hypothetical protein